MTAVLKKVKQTWAAVIELKREHWGKCGLLEARREVRNKLCDVVTLEFAREQGEEVNAGTEIDSTHHRGWWAVLTQHRYNYMLYLNSVHYQCSCFIWRRRLGGIKDLGMYVGVVYTVGSKSSAPSITVYVCTGIYVVCTDVHITHICTHIERIYDIYTYVHKSQGTHAHRQWSIWGVNFL